MKFFVATFAILGLMLPRLDVRSLCDDGAADGSRYGVLCADFGPFGPGVVQRPPARGCESIRTGPGFFFLCPPRGLLTWNLSASPHSQAELPACATTLQTQHVRLQV